MECPYSRFEAVDSVTVGTVVSSSNVSGRCSTASSDSASLPNASRSSTPATTLISTTVSSSQSCSAYLTTERSSSTAYDNSSTKQRSLVTKKSVAL